MYVQQPKKMLIMDILDILRRYSDQNHRLSQKDIADLLEKDFQMKADRKSIRRNLMDLMDCGYEIEYRETVRQVTNSKTGKTEESSTWTDFYLVRDFTDGELRLLIDSLLFSRNVPQAQSRELMQKLELLSSKYFQSRVRHIQSAQDPAPRNGQLFYTIEVLDEAISRGRQVEFSYLEYGTDKLQHKRCRSDGTVRVYRINPYQMVAREGWYYLICNNDRYETVANYRIDRIADIRLLDSPSKPFEALEGARSGRLDLARYMAENVYMYSGKNVTATFRIRRGMVSDVIDLFGLDVSFFNETETTVDVRVPQISEGSVLQFAKRYAPDVIALSPRRLVEQLREDLRTAGALYDEAEQ